MTLMSLDSLQDLRMRRAMCADAIDFVREQGREPEPKMLQVLADYDTQIAMRSGKTSLNDETRVDDGVRERRSGGSGTGRRPSNKASEKQINFLRKLVAEKDLTGVTVPTCLETITSTAASALIERLIDRAPKAGVVSRRPATERQVAFLRVLMSERDWAGVVAGVEVDTDRTDPASLTSAVASTLIETLKSAPRKQVRRAAPAVELVDGFYLFEGTYYLVQHAVHGSGHQYAKAFDAETKTFDIASGMVRKLRPEHALSDEAAEQFGQVYGRCGKCGRTLTDKNVSMKVGIGPECRKKG